MEEKKRYVVTGAFGYLGRYITARLLAQGGSVATLTGHGRRANPFSVPVQAFPFDFDRPDRLVEHLRGASALFNTYWVRFDHGGRSYAGAVENTRVLIRAAREAGVRRFVHVSITNPSPDSPFPYFRGKAEIEAALEESGLSFAVMRPTVLFGREDILINNIAWLLRRLPLFGIFGRGDYAIQPVFVDDAAALAVELAQSPDSVTVDAVGPERFTFEAMVRQIRDAVGSRSRILHLSPGTALLAGRVLGRLLRDVVITRDEIGGLMAGLLVSGHAPRCATSFSRWLSEHADSLGRRYASELGRHYRGGGGRGLALPEPQN